MVRSTIPSTRGRSSIVTPRKFFDSYPDFDIISSTTEMYEHRGYFDHANTLQTHGKGEDGFLFMSDKRQFTERFFSKGSDKTESGHPIGMFFSSAAKIVTFVINLNLHFVFWHSCVYCSTISNFFDFFLDCNQIRFRTQ